MERRKAIVNALLGDGGSLTNYTPTLRERVSDGIRRALFTDDRAGQQRAEKVSNVLDFTPVGMATGMYDAGREAGQGNYGPGAMLTAMAFAPGPSPKIAGFSMAKRTPHSIDALVDGKNVGTVNLSENHPYISSIFVEPEYRGKGIGAALYGEAETVLGRPLVPSPLGLSEDAKKMWQKNLSTMSPDEAKKIIDEAWAIGRGYGVKDAHISERLDPLLSKGTR